MKRTTQEIATFVGGELRGAGSTVIESVASLRNAGPADLSYAEEKHHGEVAQSGSGCVLVAGGDFADRTVILAKNPKLAFAKAAAWLLEQDRDDEGIHPSAVVAPDVLIGDKVTIGPNAVIDAAARIGNGTVIEAGCYVGKKSRIGDGCLLYPKVVVYGGVQLGNRVIVHAGAVIGADGFGFVRDGGRYVKFPQVGGVIIEDDVEIGANTCIDRGSLETTIIRRGVKLDNLIQVGHNVEIGEDTVIAAQTGISGSATIGARCIIGGQVGIGEHARLGDNSIIGGQGGILNGKKIRGGEVLWGTPVRPLKEFLRQQAYLTRAARDFDKKA
jgi:UDP-3-O-[3-hydroxymyristoyl] glucosamine N-acyltransferase